MCNNKKRHYDIVELERIMVENGLVLRAVPKQIREVYEICHQKQFPDAKIEFLEAYNREMLVRERKPKYGGMFLAIEAKNTNGRVDFGPCGRYRPKFYSSISDLLFDLETQKNQ